MPSHALYSSLLSIIRYCNPMCAFQGLILCTNAAKAHKPRRDNMRVGERRAIELLIPMPPMPTMGHAPAPPPLLLSLLLLPLLLRLRLRTMCPVSASPPCPPLTVPLPSCASSLEKGCRVLGSMARRAAMRSLLRRLLMPRSRSANLQRTRQGATKKSFCCIAAVCELSVDDLFP